MRSPPLAAAIAGLAVLLVGRPAAAQQTDAARAQCLKASDDGQTLRDSGKLRAARTAFLACAKPECPKTVRRDCTAWLEGVAKDLPTLVVTAVDVQGGDVTNVRLWFDGEKILERLSGAAVAVDPGDHTLYVEYGGGRIVEQRLVVRQGERDRRVTFKIPAPPTAEAPITMPFAPGAATAPPPEVQPTPPVAPAERRPTTTNYIVGGIAGAVGLGLLGTGIYFESQLLGEATKLQALCPHPCSANSTNGKAAGPGLSTEASDRAGTIVSFSVSAVALATATYFFVARPFRTDVAPVGAFDFSPGPHGATARWTVEF